MPNTGTLVALPGPCSRIRAWCQQGQKEALTYATKVTRESERVIRHHRSQG